MCPTHCSKFPIVSILIHYRSHIPLYTDKIKFVSKYVSEYS